MFSFNMFIYIHIMFVNRHVQLYGVLVRSEQKYASWFFCETPWNQYLVKKHVVQKFIHPRLVNPKRTHAGT